jgi:hypothetical protein
MDDNKQQEIVADYLMFKKTLALAMDYSVEVEDSNLIDEAQTILENFLTKLSKMQREEFSQIVENYMQNQVEACAKQIYEEKAK